MSPTAAWWKMQRRQRKKTSSLEYKILFPQHFCGAYSLLEEGLCKIFHATLKYLQARQANAPSALTDMAELQAPYTSTWKKIEDLEECKDTDCPLMHTKG